ncbi:uncharacterized protein LOC133200445 [Saccostrea echinata]|uniref:uncharacterized protein LOC133200445 n=1 Tax=Saccostrea echinata TaxID=191078 RepID=UPI002A831DCB|nr:uncharacterized protein LOC133200445 [Saccostrea echinata]XP_061192227.1 uncharacterized protein LOC133200445 [Saccostrea echinata]XP_061192228.1 uncharacterized protein LOC133200445 [Saccostrea echinata]
MTFNEYILLASVLLVCSLITSSLGGRKSPCPQSVDIASIHITKCPQNRKEMEDRSKTFKCEERKQNCTTADLYKYHCVLNSRGDGYIELCAPEVEIIGRRCTEFTTGGKFLQEHLESKCATCPFKYMSSESYKYEECYKVEFPRTLSSIMKEKTTESLKNKHIIIVSENDDMDDRSLDEAVKDTEETHPDAGSDDGDTIYLPLIITLACILPLGIVVFVVYKLYLQSKMVTITQRRKGDRTTDARKDESERFTTEAI